MSRFLPALLVLLAAPALAAPLELGGGYGAIDAKRDISPLALAERFCAGRQRGDMAELSAFLAPKLAAVLAKRAPDSVPWQSYPDRPTGCALAVLNGYDDTIGVLVRITYEAPGRSWSDDLNFERTPQSWRLNNVFYAIGGNLRFRLFQQE